MSDRYSDWVHVVPAAGELKATARELLSLASSTALVRTESNGTEFLVHPDVAEAYNGVQVPSNPFEDETPAPAPKRRGRPRKNPVEE